MAGLVSSWALEYLSISLNTTTMNALEWEFYILFNFFCEKLNFSFLLKIKRLQNELQQLNKNNPTVVKLPIRLESVQLTETPFEKTATPQQSSVDFQFQKSIKSETMSTKPSLSSDPLVWSESDVEKSLGEKGLGPIHEILRPLDGKVLHQLHLVQTHTPEFFYKSLTKNDSIDIKLIAFFSLYLKQLFE